MDRKSYNLLTEPWIKVLAKDSGDTVSVSLIDVLQNARQYERLAGEMRVQDFAIMRILLAILTTVYSRFDAQGEGYNWLDYDSNGYQVTRVKIFEDDQRQELLDSWNQTFTSGSFSRKVFDYLNEYSNRFDFLGEHPFMQVTHDEYNSLVSADKKIEKGSGQVLIKQINRSISESGNTSFVFSPKSNDEKDKIDLPELVRWVITYQGLTGVTDKTKVQSKEKYSISPGWLFQISPVFIRGSDLFQTLMLNLLLFNPNHQGEFNLQKPIWEETNLLSYAELRLSNIFPNDIAGLYTSLSRMLHISWKDEGPQIFSAGLPKLDIEQNPFEPMTTWKKNKDKKRNIDFVPAVKSKWSISKAMWRYFGQYVGTDYSGNEVEPGIIAWLRQLKNNGYIDDSFHVNVSSVSFINDGNATSQLPVEEIHGELSLYADVLFDDDIAGRWTVRIEKIVEQIENVGKMYYGFLSNINGLEGGKGQASDHEMGQFYDLLNQPFESWLNNIHADDNRDMKELEWRKTLWELVQNLAKSQMDSATSKVIRGKVEDQVQTNIFTIYNSFMRRVWNSLELEVFKNAK